jgi:pyridoxal phosphate enzyme (YggS family)
MTQSPLSVDIPSNYQNVLRRIDESAKKSGRDGSEISLVGVTKRIEMGRIQLAIDAGLKIIGEVVGTELKTKILQIKNYSPSTELHVVGRMQSNKVKFAVENCNLIQSVQQEKILSLINKRAINQNKIYPILIQVDFSNVEFLKGLNIKETLKFLDKVKDYSNVCVHGIMTIAPLEFERDQKFLRKLFSKTTEIFENQIKPLLMIDNPQLSMGMSNDFDVAIEEGSNMVRIGTSIFGPRLPK